MNVFIVDDSAILRDRLKEMLSELPNLKIIGEAGDARAAVTAILQLLPDVVLLDIRMPGGNGIDVIKKIKAAHFFPVVIVITNYPYPQYRKKCMALGADFFFSKSDEFEKISEVLGKLIQDNL